MVDFIWQDLLSESDQHTLEAAGYRTRGASTYASRGDGVRPALLLIDMQRLFVGADVPLLEAIATEPTMIGERGWRAIETMLPLLAACRAAHAPIIYAVMQPHNRPVDDPLLKIVPPLQPHTADIILPKTTTSPFHGGELAHILRQHNVDSVIVVGNSTSGCVRATVIDAVQHGYPATVPYDCVFDRIELSHKASLLDMWMKYATVQAAQDVIAALQARETSP